MGNTAMTLTLSKDEFIALYKACEDRQQKLDHTQRTSDDEDAIADAGNDLVEIGMTLRRLKEMADDAWGETGWSTSDEYL